MEYDRDSSRPSPVASNTSARAFTLTEVLIAMALTAILLVGISRIFGLTSNTIKTGQAFAKAMRQQKAVYSALSRDLLGTSMSGNIAEPDDGSGLIPIGSAQSLSARQPELIIGNFRVPTFPNRSEMDRSGTTFTFPAARGSFPNGQEIDPNDSTKIRNGGPIFAYGQRNFRIDTLGFFSRGSFSSQTGGAVLGENFIAPTTATEAWIWYGHLKVFAGSDPGSIGQNLNYINYFCTPGVPFSVPTTATGQSNKAGQPNRNSFFAEDFKLGRMSILLVPPQAASNGERYIRDDNGLRRPYLYRGWQQPTDTGTAPVPFAPNSTDVHIVNAALSDTDSVYIPGSTTTAYDITHALVDVTATTSREFRSRLSTLQNTATWWTFGFCQSVHRFNVNPFPAKPFDAAKMSQRSQLLTEGCSQFIVEFAGDYLTQDANGVVQSAVPDGTIDFVRINNINHIRWYGLPRDVDGDGVIAGNTNAARLTSLDVIPVRDLGGQRAFERTVLVPNNNYGSITTETGDLDTTSYVCIWAPAELDAGLAPKLIRVIVEMRDPAGALQTPVTQEYVFPVKQ
ncbi:MAG: prepilin-type N-terminal cleavage/methylation domain-containing protein [Tepidisphaeraceae bacterium]